MKKYLFLLAIVISIMLQSCDLEGSENYTPRIELGNYILNQNGDTLNFRASTTEINTLLLDTIYVGDTVNFSMIYNAYANNIINISLKQSADSLTRIKLPPADSLNTIFSAESDYYKGYFVLNQKAGFVYFPFQYIALAKSNEAKLTIKVFSDAEADNFSGVSNMAEIIFKTPIKEASVQ